MPTSSFRMWGASSPHAGASNIRSSKMACGGQHECRIPTFALRRKGRAPPSTAPACCPGPTGAPRKLPPHPRSRGAARSPAHANNSARQKDGACSTESLIVSPVACSGNGFGVVGSLGLLRRYRGGERSRREGWSCDAPRVRASTYEGEASVARASPCGIAQERTGHLGRGGGGAGAPRPIPRPRATQAH